jgi:hypothetical protein
MKRSKTPIRPTAPRPVRTDDLARACGGVETWNAWWHQMDGTGGGSGPSGS